MSPVTFSCDDYPIRTAIGKKQSSLMKSCGDYFTQAILWVNYQQHRREQREAALKQFRESTAVTDTPTYTKIDVAAIP